MPSEKLTSYRVWDVTTRLFHWINFGCVVGLVAVGTCILFAKSLGVSNEGKILLKSTHVWFGYVFAANLLWRLVWGFIGNRFARWRAILPFGRGYFGALSSYIAAMRKGEPQAYLGHNPVGRLAVFSMLALLVVQGVTGLILAGTDIYYPPFGYFFASWVASAGVDPSTIVAYDKTGVDPAAYEAMRAFRSPVIFTHFWVFFGLLGVIFVHVVGAVVTEIREGGGIVSAMFTGRKVFDRPPVDE